jgi:hypothetical protein
MKAYCGRESPASHVDAFGLIWIKAEKRRGR